MPEAPSKLSYTEMRRAMDANREAPLSAPWSVVAQVGAVGMVLTCYTAIGITRLVASLFSR